MLLACAAAGAAAGLAHPPVGVLPGLLGFAVLMHLLDGASPERPLRSGFARAWAAGAAFFIVSTWWIGEAFMVDIAVHGWQAPFAVLGLSAGLGLLWGFAGAIYARAAPRPGTRWAGRRVLVFAALFALAEWVRGHFLTGFPWDLPGETWRAGSAMSQSASLIGAYGLSVVTLALAAAPGVLRSPDSRRAKAVTVGSAALVLAGLYAFGAARLSQTPPAATGLTVRVVQANVPQEAKWEEAAFRDIFGRYMRLTAAPSADGRAPDVVIWPESAIPADSGAYLAPGTWTRAALLDALRPGQTLMTGAQRSEQTSGRYFNSLLVLRREAADLRLLASYDKHHLVPLGEYLPFSPVMTAIGFRALAHIPADFTAGPIPAPISPAGLPRVQPLICYETLFPGYTPGGAERPAWIVNVSNDAWFGKISGPWQHLNIASYRAIEEGVPIIRATPTGVSAVIDAHGRPKATLGTSRQGVIDAPLPPALSPTPYSRLRDGPFWFMVISGLVCAWRKPSSFRRGQG